MLHIAHKRLAIPQHIDVLMVEQVRSLLLPPLPSPHSPEGYATHLLCRSYQPASCAISEACLRARPCSV